MPYLRRRRAVQVRAQRRERTVLRVPPADHTRRAGGRQPRPGEPRPALRGGQLPPLVVRRGRRVPLVGLTVGGDQPGRVGQLDPERGHRLGHVQRDGRPLQVAHAQPAGPQHRRAALVPLLQQLLDGRQRRQGLPGRGGVHNLWTVRGGRLHLRRYRLRRAVRPARAQVQGDLAGQDDRARRGRQQQAAVQQMAQVRRRIVGDLAVRRSPHQPVQHLAGLLGQAGEEPRHPLPVGEQLTERRHGGDRVVRRGQPDDGQDLLDPARRHPRRRLPHTGSEPRRRGVLRGGREQLTGGAHQPQPVVGPPYQGLFAQEGDGPGQGRRDDGVPPVTGHEPEQLVVRRRVRRHGQRLRRLQREPVQPLQCPYDRGPGARPGGELREVRGHGGDEVGAAAQEGGQRDVVPDAERLREGPGGRGLLLGAHPAHVSGWVRRWGTRAVARCASAAPGRIRYLRPTAYHNTPPRRAPWGSRATRSSTST